MLSVSVVQRGSSRGLLLRMYVHVNGSEARALVKSCKKDYAVVEVMNPAQYDTDTDIRHILHDGKDATKGLYLTSI